MQLRTAVIILNWNTRDYLSRFLPALVDSLKGKDAELIVADNGSTDGSVDMMERDFPAIRTIALESNFGFTGGYNRAVRQLLDSTSSHPDYLVLINSDILVSENWLNPLVQYMDSHPDCGICGPKLHALSIEDGKMVTSDRFEYAGAAGGYLDRYGFPFCRGRVMKRTEMDCGQYDAQADLMWVSGACLMTRSSLWKELGGLDERFFAHMEEIDYCWRAQRMGYKVACISSSCVHHLGGGTLSNDSPFKLKLNYRNSLLMLEKNLPGTIGAKRAGRLIMTRRLIDRCASIAYLLSGRTECCKAVIQAHKEYRQLRGARTDEGRTEIDGMFGFSIIIQSLLRGDGVFKYVKRYEDSHSRCR